MERSRGGAGAWASSKLGLTLLLLAVRRAHYFSTPNLNFLSYNMESVALNLYGCSEESMR